MAVFYKRISELLLKHLRNELTESEQQELEQWAASSEENRRLFSQLTTDESFLEQLKEYHNARQNIFEKIESGIAEQPVLSIAPKKAWKKYLAAAAVIGVLATAAFYFFLSKSTPDELVTTPIPSSSQQLSSILPGGNRATLTTGGSVINLDSAANGIIEAGGSEVMKLKNGELEYKATLNQQQAIVYSTLATQNGTYKIGLHDGTQVWLNALSSIKYPNAFTGTERIVEITGEVYFEVAHNAAMPFIVKKANSDVAVRVLGTHFNINAYDDEKELKVTLLEGSVRVSQNDQSKMLKPGEQVRIINNQLSVIKNVDIEESIAWKNGRFQFSSADLGTVLREASRWYDIEISYPNGIPGDTFTGPIPKSLNLEDFLHILDLSEVKFELKENRKLLVYKKR